LATFNFSALANNAIISFNPNTDVLNFDQTTISAADVSVQTTGPDRGTDTQIIAAGKTILLANTVDAQLATTNVHFANGSQLLFGDNSPNAFAGDDAANSISGTTGNDLIRGFGGNDTIFANSGNDRIESGAGNDTISGGSGQDTYVWHEFGAANADTVLNFDTAWDKIELDGTKFTQMGNPGRFVAGDARFFAAAGANSGHDADDRIVYNTTTGQLWYDPDGNGAQAAQLIATLPAGAVLAATDITVVGRGVSADQTINGTAGNDSLVGGPGNDTINGLGGDDSISGLAGNDSLSGGDGNDTLSGGFNNDTIDGGAGLDTLLLSGALSDVTVNLSTGVMAGGDAAGTANAVLSGIESVDASNLGRHIAIVGSGGNDLLRGGFQPDTINGSAGDDTIYGAQGPSNSAGGDHLFGGDGNDLITGFGSNVVLDGGAGSDILVGDPGDTFEFSAPVTPANADSIAQWANGDSIGLDATVMPALGSNGDFSANDIRFYSAPGATGGHDADDRVVYDSTSGKLYYDPDGSGAAPAQLIATLSPVNGATPTLTASNFFVLNGTTGAGFVINGTNGDDSLTGSDSNDTISGLDGNDTLVGGAGDDSLDGGAGNDSIISGPGLDMLIGGDGNDTLDGTSNNPNGPGLALEADTLSGGLGDDTYIVDASDVIQPDPGGVDTVVAFDTDWTLGSGLENLTLTQTGIGSGLQNGTGNELNNLIQANLEFGGNLHGLGGNDTLLGGQKASGELFGDDGNDVLMSRSSAHGQVMNGGAGNDTLTGGGGIDVFVFDVHPGTVNADVITNFASDDIQLGASVMGALGGAGRMAAGDPRFSSGAGDTSQTTISYDTTTGNLWYNAALGNADTGPQLIATLSGAPTLLATDIVVVGQGNQTIVGTAGNDSLTGGDGNDTIQGLAGNDTLQGGFGNDSLDGGAGNDSLVGGGGLDVMIGGDGNDTLDGTTSGANGEPGEADTLDGGLGDDVYIVGANDVILADPGGIDTVMSLVTWTLGAGLDNLKIVATGRIDGQGATENELNNTLDLSGVDHAGTVHGMGGDDIIFVGQHQGGTVFGDDGNDTIHGELSTQLALVSGGAGDDVLIAGPSGALEGDAGSDSFVFLGLAGSDIADFASGVDKIHLDASRVMTALGTTGNFGANDPRFFAAAGATGGHDADDRFIYDTATGTLYYDADGNGSGLAVPITVVDNGGAPAVLAATDIFVDNGTAAGSVINGTDGNDSLVGTTGNDTINGFAGNDTIDGGAGADSMVGGAGDDLYFVDNPGDVIVEQSTEGVDEVRASVDFTLPAFVNNLTLVGNATHGTGNDISNVITGNAALNSVLDGGASNDTLIGGAGNDSLTGGTGSDSLVGGDGNDTLNAQDDVSNANQEADTLDGGFGDDTYLVGEFDTILADPGGFDTVEAFDTNWTLGAGLENLNLVDNLGFSYDGTGNDLNNVIRGASEGGTLSGLGGDDLLIIRAIQNGGAAFGGDGNDTLLGSDAFGGDRLDGGAGNDVLTGGGGPDQFAFTVAPGAANADTITDFTSGSDSIHLDGRPMTAIGASGTFAAGDARFFAGAGANAGHDADDRVVFNTTTGQLWYDADGSGTGTAQLIATLQAGATLAATDIVVENGSATPPPPPPPPPGSIVGTEGNDTLSGTTGNDTIFGLGGADFVSGDLGNDSLVGGAGNDTIFGDSGNDWIEGSAGNDALSGGSGQDNYVFREFGAANADTLGQFDTQWDAMRLDHNAFTAIGALGQFAAGDARFFAAAGATAGHDADDRMIYNTTTGQLFYDADGNGAGDAQLVATIQGAPAVAANDLWVI